MAKAWASRWHFKVLKRHTHREHFFSGASAMNESQIMAYTPLKTAIYKAIFAYFLCNTGNFVPKIALPGRFQAN